MTKINDIIESLRNEPDMWNFSHDRLMRKERGLFYEHIMFDPRIGMTTLNGVYVPHIRDFAFIDRLRLRFAVWQWKRKGK